MCDESAGCFKYFPDFAELACTTHNIVEKLPRALQTHEHNVQCKDHLHSPYDCAITGSFLKLIDHRSRHFYLSETVFTEKMRGLTVQSGVITEGD